MGLPRIVTSNVEFHNPRRFTDRVQVSHPDYYQQFILQQQEDEKRRELQRFLFESTPSSEFPIEEEVSASGSLSGHFSVEESSRSGLHRFNHENIPQFAAPPPPEEEEVSETEESGESEFQKFPCEENPVNSVSPVVGVSRTEESDKRVFQGVHFENSPERGESRIEVQEFVYEGISQCSGLPPPERILETTEFRKPTHKKRPENLVSPSQEEVQSEEETRRREYQESLSENDHEYSSFSPLEVSTVEEIQRFLDASTTTSGGRTLANEFKSLFSNPNIEERRINLDQDAVTPSSDKLEPEIKIEMMDEEIRSPDFIDEKLTLKEIDNLPLSIDENSHPQSRLTPSSVDSASPRSLSEPPNRSSKRSRKLAQKRHKLLRDPDAEMAPATDEEKDAENEEYSMFPCSSSASHSNSMDFSGGIDSETSISMDEQKSDIIPQEIRKAHSMDIQSRPLPPTPLDAPPEPDYEAPEPAYESIDDDQDHSYEAVYHQRSVSDHVLSIRKNSEEERIRKSNSDRTERRLARAGSAAAEKLNQDETLEKKISNAGKISNSHPNIGVQDEKDGRNRSVTTDSTVVESRSDKNSRPRLIKSPEAVDVKMRTHHPSISEQKQRSKAQDKEDKQKSSPKNTEGSGHTSLSALMDKFVSKRQISEPHIKMNLKESDIKMVSKESQNMKESQNPKESQNLKNPLSPKEGSTIRKSFKWKNFLPTLKSNSVDHGNKDERKDPGSQKSENSNINGNSNEGSHSTEKSTVKLRASNLKENVSSSKLCTLDENPKKDEDDIDCADFGNDKNIFCQAPKVSRKSMEKPWRGFLTRSFYGTKKVDNMKNEVKPDHQRRISVVGDVEYDRKIYAPSPEANEKLDYALKRNFGDILRNNDSFFFSSDDEGIKADIINLTLESMKNENLEELANLGNKEFDEKAKNEEILKQNKVKLEKLSRQAISSVDVHPGNGTLKRKKKNPKRSEKEKKSTLPFSNIWNMKMRKRSKDSARHLGSIYSSFSGSPGTSATMPLRRDGIPQLGDTEDVRQEEMTDQASEDDSSFSNSINLNTNSDFSTSTSEIVPMVDTVMNPVTNVIRSSFNTSNIFPTQSPRQKNLALRKKNPNVMDSESSNVEMKKNQQLTVKRNSIVHHRSTGDLLEDGDVVSKKKFQPSFLSSSFWNLIEAQRAILNCATDINSGKRSESLVNISDAGCDIDVNLRRKMSKNRSRSPKLGTIESVDFMEDDKPANLTRKKSDALSTVHEGSRSEKSEEDKSGNLTKRRMSAVFPTLMNTVGSENSTSEERNSLNRRSLKVPSGASTGFNSTTVSEPWNKMRIKYWRQRMSVQGLKFPNMANNGIQNLKKETEGGSGGPLRSRKYSTTSIYGLPDVLGFLHDDSSRGSTISSIDGLKTPAGNSLNGFFDEFPPLQLEKPKWEDLHLWGFEPESWTSRNPKHDLSSTEIKRQNVIDELYRTEKHHCQVIVFFQQAYQVGLRSLNLLTEEQLTSLIPDVLDSLLDFHLRLLRRMKERRELSPVVETVSDIVAEEFANGQLTRAAISAYTSFCISRNDSCQTYSDLCEKNIKVRKFFEVYEQNPEYKNRDFKSCFLLIAQRLTKYNVIFGQILKLDPYCQKPTTQIALTAVKDFAFRINSEIEQNDIRKKWESYAKILDPLSKGRLLTREFSYDDLIHQRLDDPRQVLAIGPVQYVSSTIAAQTRSYKVELTLVLFDDVLVLFWIKGNKMYFYNYNNISSVIPLKSMIARVVERTNDMRLIVTDPEKTDMYLLRFELKKDLDSWISAIHSAQAKAPSTVKLAPGRKPKDTNADREEQIYNRKLQGWEKTLEDIFKNIKDNEQKLAEYMEGRMSGFDKVKNLVDTKFKELRKMRRKKLDALIENALKVRDGDLQSFFDDIHDLSHASSSSEKTEESSSSEGESSRKPRRVKTYHGTADSQPRPGSIRRHTTVPKMKSLSLGSDGISLPGIENEEEEEIELELKKLPLSITMTARDAATKLIEENVRLRMENNRFKSDVAMQELHIASLKSRKTAMKLLKEKESELEFKVKALSAGSLRSGSYVLQENAAESPPIPTPSSPASNPSILALAQESKYVKKRKN
ncbi:hypothetical protein FO519_005681 [Halicephalobus sp. NKZ332]|nr:hypothetical protein FO519_005681 [Halicephalobus sp. NKZ332]